MASKQVGNVNNTPESKNAHSSATDAEWMEWEMISSNP